MVNNNLKKIKYCPNCNEILIKANLGNGIIDIYCEECGFPTERRESNPKCVVCGDFGVGICHETWRCDEHWID